jgi:hypothetical protein
MNNHIDFSFRLSKADYQEDWCWWVRIGTEFGRLLIIFQVYNLCRSLTEINIQNSQSVKNIISYKLFRVNLFSHTGSNNTNCILIEKPRPFTAGPEKLSKKWQLRNIVHSQEFRCINNTLVW